MSERKSSIDNTPAAMGSMSGETTLRFLLSVFHSSPNAVSISDLEGNLRLVNSRALQLFGHADDSDVIGRSIFAWISPEDHTVAREALQQLTTEGEGHTTAPAASPP
ncbi:MAG: PAS domain S-box protein [Ignavibacteriae bacterium]|nr:PAS domain S-box protein [Ignavibacteriota bacterium]